MERFARIIACMALAAFGLAAPAPAFADEPVATPVLVVVVGFDGGDGGQPVPYDADIDWAGAVFGGDESPASFYRDMSGGAFTFAPAPEASAYGVLENDAASDRANDGVVHVTLHRARGTDWGLVNDDPAIAQEFGEVVIEAFQRASAYVDFGSFDADGNGTLTGDELVACFVIAGYDASSLSDPGRADVPVIWPHAGVLATGGDPDDLAGGTRLESYIAIAERLWLDYDDISAARQEPIGIVYHELGHALGLPDLYAVKTVEGAWENYKVGALSLMDSGGWLEDGDGNSAPAALDAWSRYVLGWTRPAIALQSGDYTVQSQLSEGGYTQVVIPTADPDQYFIVENRQLEGHDRELGDEYAGGGGIVVWHVDNAMYRAHFLENQVDDADHRPAVMELFAYGDAAGPQTDSAFFSAETWPPEEQGPVALMLYDPSADDPSALVDSGIALSFGTGSARTMTVHVEIAADLAGQAQNALHLLHDPARADLGSQLPPFGRIVWIADSLKE